MGAAASVEGPVSAEDAEKMAGPNKVIKEYVISSITCLLVYLFNCIFPFLDIRLNLSVP